MSIEKIFKWDSEASLFKTKPVCYACSYPISFHQAHKDISVCCEKCNAPIELFGAKSKEGKELFYLWRNPNQSYCFFTGEKFSHVSDFDWTSKRGNSLLNSSISDPSQKLYGIASKGFRWDFLHTGSILVSKIFERFNQDEYLTSLNIFQGKILAMSNVGNLYQIGIEHEYPVDRFTENACSYSRHNFIKNLIPWTKGTCEFPESPLLYKDFIVQIGISNEGKMSLIRGYKGQSETPEFEIEGQFWRKPILIDSKKEDFQGFLVINQKDYYGSLLPGLLSIYNFFGEEIFRVSTVIEQCAHPPIYDQKNDCIIWVSLDGSIFIINLNNISMDKSQEFPIDLTSKIEKVAINIPDINGTNVVFKTKDALFSATYTSDNNGSLDFVFVNQTQNVNGYNQASTPYLLNSFHPIASERTTLGFRWMPIFSEHEYFTDNIIPFTEFCLASSHLQVNISQDMIAFINREKLLICNKMEVAYPPITLDSAMFESPDPPIFTPAGIIYRNRTTLCLAGSQKMGWTTDSSNDIISINLPSKEAIQREHARGIVVSGRHVYVAVNDTIHIYELHKINLG